MFKMSVIGGLMCVAGLVLYGFQVLSSLVGEETGEWNRICLYDLIHPEHIAWIDKMTWMGIDRALDSVASAPLYVLLPIVGGILLAISGFRKN